MRGQRLSPGLLLSLCCDGLLLFALLLNAAINDALPHINHDVRHVFVGAKRHCTNDGKTQKP